MDNDFYGDPAVAARFDDITARHGAAMAQLAEEHQREIEELDRAGAERDRRTAVFLDKLAAAVQRREQAKKPEPQHQWPEREKKNRVLSFGETDEPPTPAPPPGRPSGDRVRSFGQADEQRPTPTPTPPPRSGRSSRDRVMSFGQTDEQPTPPPSRSARARGDRVLSFGEADEPSTPAPPPEPAKPDRPSKGRVLSFSTEDDEDEGFSGFRRRR